MKKFVLSIAFIVFTVLAVDAQSTEGVPAANPNAAEITFEADVHDYGIIKQNADGNFLFKFKNTGKEPLIISAATGSCGCTVPTAPLNQPFKPGESGVIKVHYDTNRTGVFTKTVTVTSNAKTTNKILTIKGKVEPTPVEEPFPVKKTSGAPFETVR